MTLLKQNESCIQWIWYEIFWKGNQTIRNVFTRMMDTSILRISVPPKYTFPCFEVQLFEIIPGIWSLPTAILTYSYKNPMISDLENMLAYSSMLLPPDLSLFSWYTSGYFFSNETVLHLAETISNEELVGLLNEDINCTTLIWDSPITTKKSLICTFFVAPIIFNSRKIQYQCSIEVTSKNMDASIRKYVLQRISQHPQLWLQTITQRQCCKLLLLKNICKYYKGNHWIDYAYKINRLTYRIFWYEVIMLPAIDYCQL